MDKSYRQQLSLSDRQYRFYDIAAYLADHGQDVETVPYSVRVLLEEALDMRIKILNESQS